MLGAEFEDDSAVGGASAGEDYSAVFGVLVLAVGGEGVDGARAGEGGGGGGLIVNDHKREGAQ